MVTDVQTHFSSSNQTIEKIWRKWDADMALIDVGLHRQYEIQRHARRDVLVGNFVRHDVATVRVACGLPIGRRLL